MSRHTCFWIIIVLGLLLSPLPADAYSTSKQHVMTLAGENAILAFTGLPQSSGNVSVTVSVYGDYDHTSEAADIYADNVYQGKILGGSPQCNTSAHTASYTLSSSTISDQKLNVRVQNSPLVNPAECTGPNASRVVVSISYTALPDLSVVSLTVPASGTVASAGSSFTVSYSLKGSNEAITTDFFVDLFYCSAAATTNCLHLASQYITNNFSANQTLNFTSASLTLPTSAEYGTRYIRMVVDSGSNVSEANETNNAIYKSFSITARPDLYIPSATVPSPAKTLTPGTSFQGNFVISNTTKTSAANATFILSFYYCTAKTTTGCTIIGSEQLTLLLNSGSSITHSAAPMMVPTSAASGTGYIRAFVDSTSAVLESNESNNNYYSTINITSSSYDLLLSSTTVPFNGDTKHAGSTFTTQCQVKNNSTSSLSTPFIIYHYFCLSAGTANCALLGQSSVSYSFSPNATYYVNSPALTVPSMAQYGTGYLRFFVDGNDAVAESNESNNNTYKSVTVSTYPDLYYLSANIPTSGNVAGPGSTFTGSFTLNNLSDSSAFTKDFSVKYYYCASYSSSTTGCTQIGKETISKDFFSGTSHNYTSTTLTLPSTAATGLRYILVQADSEQAITESNEKNNLFSKAIQVAGNTPDYYIQTFTASACGGTVQYKVTVCNLGGSTSTATNLGFYADDSSPPTCAFKPDLSQILVALKAGGCANFSFTRLNVKPGGVLSWIMADHSCALKELDEVNNIQSVSFHVWHAPDAGCVTADAGPDAMVDAGVDSGSSDATGDSGGDASGDSSGDAAGDSNGDAAGDSSGDAAGDSSGDATGDSSGGDAGDSSGGDAVGDSNQETSKDLAGDTVVGQGDSSGNGDGCDCATLGVPSSAQGLSSVLLMGLLLGLFLRTRRRR